MDDTVKPSIAKSLVAMTKPRIGGRFISAKDEGADPDSEDTPKKKVRKKKDKEITKDDLIYDTRLLTEEEKEYIGDDALKFYEIALKRARTPAEGHRYASVLVKYQHPSLSAIASKQEIEVTHKVLAWEWDGKGEVIDFDPTSTTDTEKETGDDRSRTESEDTDSL